MESRITRVMTFIVANFQFARPLDSRLRVRNGTERGMDRGRPSIHHAPMIKPLGGRRHNKKLCREWTRPTRSIPVLVKRRRRASHWRSLWSWLQQSLFQPSTPSRLAQSSSSAPGCSRSCCILSADRRNSRPCSTSCCTSSSRQPWPQHRRLSAAVHELVTHPDPDLEVDFFLLILTRSGLDLELDLEWSSPMILLMVLTTRSWPWPRRWVWVVAGRPGQLCGERSTEVVDGPGDDDVVEEVCIERDQNHCVADSCMHRARARVMQCNVK